MLEQSERQILVEAQIDQPAPERQRQDGRFALDVTDRKMYWTDWGTDKIQRANLDGTGVEDVVTTGLVDPWGIALYRP